MKKKILGILLAGAVLMSSIPVMAAEYSADGNSSVTVTAELGSTYTVTVPSTLSLTYNSTSTKYEGSYTVGAKGNITPSKKVVIAPHASSFTMTGSGTSTAATAAVTQAVTEWVKSSPSAGQIAIGSDTFATTTGDVAVTLTVADSYSGTMQIDFSLTDA